MKNYYHVKTQEAYDNLMAFLETLGYSWTTGDKPTKSDIFHRLGAETVISVSEEEKRLLYTDTHTFKQGIEIDGVSLIEWPAIALKEKLKSQKNLMNGCRRPKNYITILIKVGVFIKLIRWDGVTGWKILLQMKCCLLREAPSGRKKYMKTKNCIPVRFLMVIQ